MTIPSRPSILVKTTIDTKFHIDFDWWERSREEDLRTYMLSHLMPEQRDRISQSHEDRQVDYIDPETGEVFRLDELRLSIQLAAQDPNFINPHTSTVDSIFRVFLKYNNLPMSPRELASNTGRSAEVILKTISGGRIYKGIRPFNL
ncbi:MAG: hypothetical protein H7Y09_08695 [Chitinophagaceae bacterium]|nr:hypothetical protein [Anaerolineae bacterium]